MSCKIFKRDPKPDKVEKPKYAGIAKISPKRKQRLDDLHEKDMEFYQGIWDERAHYCAICHTWLGRFLDIKFIHHILAKGKSRYEHLRWEKENIVLLCSIHHSEAESSNVPDWCTELIERTIKYFESKGLL